LAGGHGEALALVGVCGRQGELDAGDHFGDPAGNLDQTGADRVELGVSDDPIEWCDFLLYGTVTALVFGKLYFPHANPLVGVLEAFSVFFVGFVGRPIGAAIFGHYGDRIGRKATLIATLLVTGLATFAVGLVPTYASIGIWGAVLLTVIRLIQGIGVGGEWGGSVLLAMEWAQTNKHRGFISSWPQFGAPAGLSLANLAVLVFSWFPATIS
jgi:MFS family permease